MSNISFISYGNWERIDTTEMTGNGLRIFLDLKFFFVHSHKRAFRIGLQYIDFSNKAYSRNNPTIDRQLFRTSFPTTLGDLIFKTIFDE